MWYPPPRPLEALEEARPLTDLLYPAFEFATERASAIVVAEQLPPDQHGHSTLVRWAVKGQLEKAGHEVEEFLQEELNLIGLSVSFRGNRYRIRKADPFGLLPPPGPSRRLQQFYAQQLRLPFTDDEAAALGEPEPSSHNYVILWHMQAGVLKQLSLVYPKSSREWAAEWEWHVPIPYPTDLTGWTPTPTPPRPSAPDLGLRLKRDKSARAG